MVKNDEPVLKIADKLLFTPDIFNYFLTGEMKNEYTAASTSQLLNAKEKVWDEELMQKIRDKGVQIEEVTLQVGLGTFRPVTEENALEHKMHSEEIVVSEEVAERLNKAKQEGKRIIAVGTTTVRTLESASDKKGHIVPCEKETNIFIYPGVELKFVDGLITNFHLPESTLIMLVSAFIGKDKTLDIYKEAVKEKYRFFSFGDCCFFF